MARFGNLIHQITDPSSLGQEIPPETSEGGNRMRMERLHKIIAGAGITSRRKAEELIREGRVSVNGQTVKEVGVQADPEKDHIKVDGKLIRPESLEYFAVYKPQGVLSSVSDPLNRPLVVDLVRSSRRLYPAGRLDFQSEGLIVLTNDGELAEKITRSGEIEKVYRVKVRGEPGTGALAQLRNGIRIDSEKFAPCEISPLKKGRNCWYEVKLWQGRNRQIRRMFKQVGHPVMRLRRVAIGPVALRDLSPGQSRPLTSKEVELLKGAGAS